MASGRWITCRADRAHGGARGPGLRGWPAAATRVLALAAATVTSTSTASATASAIATAPAADCHKPLYLTFDTGHMGVADQVAEVLKRHEVRVTFFAAHEKTKEGDGSLGEHWAPWWRARVAEGHEFASHTFDHVYWRADLPGGRFRVRASAGPDGGLDKEWSAADYCAEIRRAGDRLAQLTGRPPLPLFRAPGGKTSESLVRAAQACGFAHVGWSPAGFLGDELPSDRYSNPALLDKALREIRSGDILVAHLGIWSRRDPWAPAVLEPLIFGLKQRGFCFATLREHPRYSAWLARHR